MLHLHVLQLELCFQIKKRLKLADEPAGLFGETGIDDVDEVPVEFLGREPTQLSLIVTWNNQL